MSTARRVLIAFLCLGICVFSQIVDSSNLPSSPPQNPDQSAGERRIVLNVVVRDKKGEPVAGLTQGDFTVTDNKQPAKLVSFEPVEKPTADSPVEMILLIDRVNSDFRISSRVRQETKKFLVQNGAQLPLPTSMIFLSDSGTSGHLPTRDGSALADALEKSDKGLRATLPVQGIYGQFERFQMSLNTLMGVAGLEEKSPGRKLLVWIGSGWPMLTGPNVQLTTKQRAALFQSLVNVSGALQRAQITLYDVDPLGTTGGGTTSTNFYKQFLNGVPTDRDIELGNLSVQVLAIQSGGLVLNSVTDVTTGIVTCVEDASAWYVLAFDAPSASRPNQYHALDVEMGTQNLTARTRTVYYAQQSKN